MSTIKKNQPKNNSKCTAEEVETLESLWECKMVLPLWKSQKIKNTVIPYDPANLLLGVYLKEFESWVLRDSSTPVVHCRLFTIVKR